MSSTFYPGPDHAISIKSGDIITNDPSAKGARSVYLMDGLLHDLFCIEFAITPARIVFLNRGRSPVLANTGSLPYSGTPYFTTLKEGAAFTIEVPAKKKLLIPCVDAFGNQTVAILTIEGRSPAELKASFTIL